MNSKQKKLLQELAQLGEVILINEDGSRILLNEEAENPLQTQLDAVLYFIQRLDTTMLDSILDDYTFQDLDKRTFLKKLTDVFDAFVEEGNSFLNIYEGKCNSAACSNKNCKGFSFVGNKSKDYMDLIIEIRENKVFDIYECYDFINENDTFLKKNKISIDGLESKFNQ